MELSKTSGSLLNKYIGRKRERQTDRDRQRGGRGEKERDRKAIKTPNPLRDVLLAELDVLSPISQLVHQIMTTLPLKRLKKTTNYISG